MARISYHQFRHNLASYIEGVFDDRQPLVVTRFFGVRRSSRNVRIWNVCC